MDSIAARDVRVQFEALLLAPLLRPLMGEMQGAGEVELEIFAREIAARLEARP